MKDWLPMSPEQSAVQIQSILTLLGDDSKDVLDIGCGSGRLLIPLAVAGHRVVGIDSDSNAIQTATKNLHDAEIDATCIEGDFFHELPLDEQVDVIVCCGHTFMLLHDVDQALEALTLFKKSLRKGGMVIIDDIPGDLWPEVAEGNWVNGLNDQAKLQLVWAEDDAVFAIREGDAVDGDNWKLAESDIPLRLWTMGALRLLARLASLSVPEVPVRGAILVMRAQ
ncbi:class I SAM-dependent methyltransferase [bacterium]|nr:class I SAM-dependent methyltransferase [bacterium]